jgi:transcriptional regulator with XRE-family HTH domain
MEQPESPLPADALLIRRARQAYGLSPERIVKRLKRITLSGRAWRLYEDGDRPIPDDSLAHMAAAVEVSPEQLEGVGRAEAAEILREIERQDSQPEKPESNTDVAEATRQLKENPRLARAFLDILGGGPPPGPPPTTPGEDDREGTA